MIILGTVLLVVFVVSSRMKLKSGDIIPAFSLSLFFLVTMLILILLMKASGHKMIVQDYCEERRVLSCEGPYNCSLKEINDKAIQKDIDSAKNKAYLLKKTITWPF